MGHRIEQCDRVSRLLPFSDDASVDVSANSLTDDLSRSVYCVLGLPIDATDMSTVIEKIMIATLKSEPYVISTTNLNFLVTSLSDIEFKDSLLLSDICLPDGMPIVWIARLMGIPIKERIAGSDILATLKTASRYRRTLKVFLFGATEYVARAAARTLDGGDSALKCVDWICPGFGSVSELSQDRYFDQINRSRADFLVVCLSAMKGQLWLLRNRYKLNVPVRAQLGATIHFQAGTVKRAPRSLQKLGFEWLWRVGQEPKLWRRYASDGVVFMSLLLNRVLPLALKALSLRHKASRNVLSLTVNQTETLDGIILRLCGFAIDSEVEKAATAFKAALAVGKPIKIDLSETCGIDSRFLGLLLMLRKHIKSRGGADPRFSGMSAEIEAMFRLNGFEYVIADSTEFADAPNGA